VIVVVRHGRTTANARGLLLGRADPPLDDVGRAQAAAMARVVAGGDVQLVISSPLVRAVETAEIIRDGVGMAAVAVDERWIELDYGDFDGRPFADVPAESWATWRGDVRWTPPGGESIAALGERVRSACG
jgi:broad specificity phosphatase PhoE